MTDNYFSCNIPCAEGCPPCNRKCTYTCKHSKCSRKCGQPCINCKVRVSTCFIFLSKATTLCLNVPLIELWNTSLDTTLLMIHHQQHVSALEAIFRLMWCELHISVTLIILLQTATVLHWNIHKHCPLLLSLSIQPILQFLFSRLHHYFVTLPKF